MTSVLRHGRCRRIRYWLTTTLALGRSCTSPSVFAHSNLWRLEAVEDPGSGLLRRTSPHKPAQARTSGCYDDFPHHGRGYGRVQASNRRPSTRFGLMFGKLSLEIWGAL